MEEQADILIVDDNPSLREMLSAAMELMGHRVVTAQNGVQGLARLREQSVDLILSDIMMPRLDGFGFLEQIKADPDLRDVPVIMISAVDDLKSVVRCLELGAADYLFKPFDSTLLETRVNAALDKRRWRANEQAYLSRIEQEQAKAEALLRNVLPAAVVDRLKSGDEVIADSLADVTILFADIVDFTPLAAQLSATELVSLLNKIFTMFDQLAVQYRVEKIKTVGDAYMAVGGLPGTREDHTVAVADMALAMLRTMRGFAIRLPHPLSVRVGISTGPAVGGVIGRKRFAYDLWGHAVNTASRMETTGEADRIQVCDRTRQVLGDAFEFTPRGEIEVKGIGAMPAFFLERRRALDTMTRPLSYPMR